MIARAIWDAAEERDVQRASVSNFENFRGLGVRATVDGETVHIGGPNLVEKLGIDQYFGEVLPEEKDTKVEQLRFEGKFVAMVGDLENVHSLGRTCSRCRGRIRMLSGHYRVRR